MPIKLPAGVRPIRLAWLTEIRAIKFLHDKIVACDGGLVDRAKATMEAKHARFAQDDRVIAELRGGAPRQWVSPGKLYALVKSGRITFGQFLSVVRVRETPLKKLLTPPEIDRIAKRNSKVKPALFTEFRADRMLASDCIDVGRIIGHSLARAIKQVR